MAIGATARKRQLRQHSQRANPGKASTDSLWELIRRALTTMRNGSGMIVLCLLLLLYVSNFYTEANGRQERLAFIHTRDLSRLEDGHSASKISSSIPQRTSSNYAFQLPGSLSSDAKTFEGDADSPAPRDPNVLPGALNLDGPFDHEPGKPPEEKPASEAPSNSITAPTSSKPAKGSSKEKRLSISADPSELNESPRTGENHVSSEAPASSLSAFDSTPADTVEPPQAPSNSPVDSETFGRAKKLKRSRKRRVFTKTTKSSRSTSATSTQQEESSSDGDKPEPRTMPHPMSGERVDLQVEADTGQLDQGSVKEAYLRLVKAYLEPFRKGIQRKAFFNILRRKNYSLSPPESNKGIQTILLQIINKKIYMMDPYDVSKSPKSFYRTRIAELIWLLRAVVNERGTPDTEFLVAIHDCVQTVSDTHNYRGAHYVESSPTFTIVACNFSDNIPFPMWEGDDQRGGGLAGWDEKMKEYKESDTTPWADKLNQAVFRGGYRPSMYFPDKSAANQNCDAVGRSRLMYLATENPNLYDVSISGSCGGTAYTMRRLGELEHHKYKYILYAEGNCFWADRLNKQVFGPSAILKQETPCGQYWEPLLRPMSHYLPTDFFFGDATERIEWANQNPDKAESIVKNANEFASNFLSLEGIKSYVEVLLTEYSTLLEQKEIVPEKGAVDVTTTDI